MPETLGGFAQQVILVADFRNDQVCGQCDFGRTHRPDVYVVDFGDTADSIEELMHIVDVDALGNGVQRKIQ